MEKSTGFFKALADWLKRFGMQPKCCKVLYSKLKIMNKRMRIVKNKGYKKKKPVILYDATLLANNYSRYGSDRTGVFFTAYQTFLRLAETKKLTLMLYSNENKRDDVCKAVMESGYDNLVVLSGDEPVKYPIDIYLSPFHVPPKCIMEDLNISRYMILYDIAPLLLPDIESPNQGWFHQLTNSLNSRDRYFAISECTKKDFLRYYPIIKEEHISVSYLGADEIFKRCNDKTRIDKVKDKYHVPVDMPYVVTLCTLQPRKNLIHSVRCFFQFLKENNIKNLYLVMIGGHWDEFVGKLDQEIKDWKYYSKYIIKAGYVDDEDVSILLSDAMFTVYASFYEGFGLPILEAMQCGCPVIASNTSSMPEVLGDCGILVDPQDPVALRKAYKRYYYDKEWRDKCRINGLNRSRLFGWDNFANEIIETICKTWGLKEDDEKNTYREEKNKEDELYAMKLGARVEDYKALKQIEMYITQRKQESLSRLYQLITLLESELNIKESGEMLSIEEAVCSLEFYKILLDVENGKRTLQNELKKAQQLMK